MKLTFWGAVRTVTGSMHEITASGRRFLLDCGLYQGRRQEAFERNRTFPFPARNINAVLLSHAHIDHSGNLPSLARGGFNGRVYSTPATADLCDAMLRDSAFLQEKDAEWVNRRDSKRRAGRKSNAVQQVQPLYQTEDAERVLTRFRGVGYHQPKLLADGLEFEFTEAGHLLGSAVTRITWSNGKPNGKPKRLVFSGDLGRPGLPIIRDPQPCPEGDYLILESTYGARFHREEAEVAQKLAGVIRRTAERGGKVIVPAFAVGRTQQLVLLIHQLVEANDIPSIPIFVDSPLAVNATEIHRRHPECYDEETARFLANGDDPLGFGRLRYVRDVNESKSLNDLRGPMVIISASGMAEAGRILHHLRNNIGDPRSTVLIAGFQAENTLGRKLLEGHQEVPIFGEPVRLRAEVVPFKELSGHADQKGLLDWIAPVARSFQRIFLVHGELSQGEALAARIGEAFGVDTVIPERGRSFEIG